MALDAETMRLVNATRIAKLSDEQRASIAIRMDENAKLRAEYGAKAKVTPVTLRLTSVKKGATVKSVKSSKVEWEFRPLYKLGSHILGPVPGVWCKILRPRVNRGLEKRRHNQSKHTTSTFRAGTSVLYGSK